MELNCKTGDLARVVWPGVPSNNHFVTVEEFLPVGTVIVFNHVLLRIDMPCWWVHCATAIPTAAGLLNRLPFPDSRLRPIRGQPGTDETLRIAGLPAPRESTTA